MLAQIQRLLPPGFLQYPTQAEKEALNATIKNVDQEVEINSIRKPKVRSKVGEILGEVSIQEYATSLKNTGLTPERVEQAFFFRRYGRLGGRLGGGLLSIMGAVFGPASLSILLNFFATGSIIEGGYHFLNSKERAVELKRIITKMKELKP